MHEKYHILTAIPFIIAGEYATAVGCVLPDLTWIANELRFQRSSLRDWNEWSRTLTPAQVRPYRIAHSVLLWTIFALLTGWYGLAIGCCIHIMFDLPTHSGIMTQEPLYPFKWKWKWIIK